MAVRRRQFLRRNARMKRAPKKLAIERLEPRTMMAAQPVINEILASNDGVIQDEDGDYSDFIELYNRGDAAVNLGGWYLSDEATELTKWRFPSVNLAPGQYLGGSPLHPTSTATTVRVRDGKRLLTDGPFAETREHLGGYMLIDVKDLDQAIAFASRAPLARVGTIEVRPLREGPPS